MKGIEDELDDYEFQDALNKAGENPIPFEEEDDFQNLLDLVNFSTVQGTELDF